MIGNKGRALREIGGLGVNFREKVNLFLCDMACALMAVHNFLSLSNVCRFPRVYITLYFLLPLTLCVVASILITCSCLFVFVYSDQVAIVTTTLMKF